MLQGDRVMVISGDLKNLIGRVERVTEGGKVDIMPKMEGLTDILTFELTQLEKYFEVRCQQGSLSGWCGTKAAKQQLVHTFLQRSEQLLR